MKRNTDSIQPHELWEVKDYSEIMDINLKSRNRDRQTVWARYAVWLYLMEECGATLEKTIAELTGKQLIYEKTTRNEDIKQAITEVTGLLFHEIAGDSRKTIAVHARMIYSSLCYTIARIKEIAADLNRSTSSVHYYLEQHRNEYKFNPAFRELADNVSERLIQIQQRKSQKNQ